MITQNYQCRRGELDLIMQDRGTLVFVEVRQRRHNSRVSAAESVNGAKQRRMLAAARHYLMTHPEQNALPMRFDLVAMDGDNLRWEKNFLQLDGHGY